MPATTGVKQPESLIKRRLFAKVQGAPPEGPYALSGCAWCGLCDRRARNTLSLCDGRTQDPDDKSEIFCHVLPRTEVYQLRRLALSP
jgi:hypothetical protein